MNTSSNFMKSVFGALLVAALAMPGIGKAVTYTDLASWQAAAGTYSDVSLAGYAEFETIAAGSGIDLAGQSTMTLDGSVQKRIVGSSWATWADGRTPDVLYSASDVLGATFAPDVTAFGMVLEPNLFNSFTMEVLLSDGSVISQIVDGAAGATFFGWAGVAIDSITISCLRKSDGTGCDGFAIGEMVIASADVPEAASLILLSIGLLAMGFGARRRRA